jgi:hypothetical protein
VWSGYIWLMVHGNELPDSVMGREFHEEAMSRQAQMTGCFLIFGKIWKEPVVGCFQVLSHLHEGLCQPHESQRLAGPWTDNRNLDLSNTK